MSIALLAQYRSPTNEASVFKGIPIELLHFVRTTLHEKGLKYRTRYRGPSNPMYRRPQAHCIKAHATTFALYFEGTV